MITRTAKGPRGRASTIPLIQLRNIVFGPSEMNTQAEYAKHTKWIARIDHRSQAWRLRKLLLLLLEASARAE
jgi:hypothetical protein